MAKGGNHRNAAQKYRSPNHPGKVAGWANEYAAITALFPDFYQATWETVERVVKGDGNFTVEVVTLTNMRWLGTIALPKKVR